MVMDPDGKITRFFFKFNNSEFSHSQILLGKRNGLTPQ